ncbi:hypothetical protein SRHO_G00176450 [Serrasalmus rhombeus]
MLVTAINNTNCTNYRVIVSGISVAFYEMTESNREEITKALVKYLKDFVAQLNTPICRKDIQSDSEWLSVNLGLFLTTADYSDLKELNISGVVVLDSLSAQQKAELILDPSSGALENETLVKEVMMGILSSSGEEQLDVFFETFVNITKEEQIYFIENAAVRDTILNVTLMALAPNFNIFSPSQFELWFQENLFVVLASFQPSWLLVIPRNLNCDSYTAIPPLQSQVTFGNVSAQLCNFSISQYACSSVAALSSRDLGKVMACKLTSSMNYSRAIWSLFFQKFAAPLDEALDAYSNMTLNISLPDPYVLDAIGEVKLNNFSNAQLTDSVFITKWFQTRLRPFLSSVSVDFLSCLSSKNFSCQTYQVVVEALSRQDQLMEEEQKWSIFTYFIYPFLSRDDLSDPSCVSSTSGSSDWLAKNFGNFSAYASLEELLILNIHFSSVSNIRLAPVALCRKDIQSDSEWLSVNLGLFSTTADYSDLKELNISGVVVLDSLSAQQKAELILDPSSGALENETLVKEVMMGILSSSGEEQLDVFFETFVNITKEEQIYFIENAAVRDTILNVTLMALAPNFNIFSPSQFELWFQENLFVVLASFQPSWLLVIPRNLNCDSYTAIPPLQSQVTFGNVSAQLCNFSISQYACSSVAALSSRDLGKVMACKLTSSMNYSRAIWSLFFQKFAAPLDEALDAYSNMTLNISLPDPYVLDAIGEVKLNNFSNAQLTDSVFITKWFQTRLRPFLSSVSVDFLSCLSSKNFSCQTYQVVVEALSRQDQLMEEEQKWSIFTYFIYPFLSRDDLSDPSCVSSTSGSSDWLAKNFGNFSAYASLEELLILNIHFSSVSNIRLAPVALCRKDIQSDSEWLSVNLGLFLTTADYSDLKELNISGVVVLDSLSAQQKAELILDPSSGALENETLVKEVMMGILSSSGEEQLDVFFETFVNITKEEQIYFIENAAVRDTILNVTLMALAPNFNIFSPSQFELWFQENLFVVLASFQPSWLLVIPRNLNCDSYTAILKGMDMSLAVLPLDLDQELRLSREMLSQTLPKGCTMPVPVGVVAALSSRDLGKVMACKLTSSMNYSRAIWSLFFQKFAAPLDEALDAYSNMTLNISLPDPYVLDAIGEVKLNNFSNAQLTDSVFITKWFQTRLRPFLSSVSVDFLSCLSSKNFSCQTYQVVVEALSRQDQLMEEEQKWSIFTYFIYPFLSRDDLSDPSCVSSTSGSSDWLAKNFGNFSAYASLEELLILNIHFSSVSNIRLAPVALCRKDIQSDSEWLSVNLGLFSTTADYSDLKELNISGVVVLDSLSAQQKAELILDPSSGALENETLVKEVMMGILSSSGEEQLDVFFETFVNITKEEQIYFIENAAVRDTILNVTLMALAPNFNIFSPSQFELWFQENLFVVLASFQPSWLLVIPRNLNCDSYTAIPPLQSQVTFGNVSAQLCNFSISQYACSSVAALSSRDLGKVMACKLTSSMNYSRAIWSLFFQKFAAPLDEALDAYSNMTLNISLPDPYVLDAIGEVKLNNFSNAQLTDSVFITKWFQTRLRPFLSSVSVDFLSCLSSKNFSCQTYQVVVEALSRQDQLMEEEQKWSIFTYFIYPFLSRDDLSDPSCVSSTSGSSDWLAKNFGNFSAYATLEELLILNIHFSSVSNIRLAPVARGLWV